MNFFEWITDMFSIRMVRIFAWIVLFSVVVVPLIRRHSQYQGQALSEVEYTLHKPQDRNLNLVFYKRGCPYCQAAEKEVISEAKRNKNKTYFINLDKARGLAVSEQYHVHKAYTIIKIRGKKVTRYYTAKVVDGKIVANRAEISQAFK